jgi:hypothetical protein
MQPFTASMCSPPLSGSNAMQFRGLPCFPEISSHGLTELPHGRYQESPAPGTEALMDPITQARHMESYG